MRHSILQYNTDCFNHGSDYFGEVTKDVDYALFQRLPIKNELSSSNIKEIHLERSITNMRDSLYVGIARLEGTSKFSSCVSFNLPSKDIVRETKNKFQGSKALCTGVDKVVFCSMLTVGTAPAPALSLATYTVYPKLIWLISIKHLKPF